jgi:hypothetical protein
MSRELLQLGIDTLKQLVVRVSVALAHALEQVSDVAHGARIIPPAP